MPRALIKNIRWLGHSGFSIKAGGKHVVIDPYQLDACDKADIILITHAHFDHFSPEDIESIMKPETTCVTEAQAAAKIKGDVRVVKPGDRLDFGNIAVEAVWAYNVDKNFHPRSNNFLGFMVHVGGVRIYHAGDTDLIPEMDEYQAEIALLPVSGTYVMTAVEAVEAAKRIGPQIAVPMHYDAIVGSAADARAFARGLEGFCEVKVFSQ